MVLEFFRKGQEGSLAEIEGKIGLMLADARHSFDAAGHALLAGADASAIRKDVKVTDQRINETEREVRRQLVVHASVHGAAVDVPLILTYMNVVKDIERVGDYAKNVLDLARHGVDLSDADDREELRAYGNQISKMITDTARVFAERATDEATELLEQGDRLLDEFDDHVTRLVKSETPSRTGVPRALLYRYLKRVTAHLTNVLSAITMPVDQLDYFDEDKDDRLPP